jgi:hypothetical protein
MHFELPKSKTFKEFGGEYLMIVISILTALALESVVEKVHHNHLAHDASARMDVELRTNVDEVKSVLAHNESKRDDLINVHNGMLAAIRNKISEAEWRDRYDREWKKVFDISFQYPTLRSEAWDAAVANQAVTYLPQGELARYASIYGNVRDINGLFHGGMMSFLDGPRLLDTMSNTELGIANREELFRTVNQIILSYNNIDGNLKDLQKRLQAAEGRKPAS